MTAFDPHSDPKFDPIDALVALLETRIGQVDGPLEPADEPVDHFESAQEPAAHPLTETANEEIAFYAIELDESFRTPEALAARDRILAKLGLPPIQPDDESPLTQELVETTFSALISVNLWEDIDAELVVARRGGTSLPPRDITVPELADLGYRPEVEIEIDFDPTEESATLTFLLDRIEPEQDASAPPRLRIVLETPSDFQTHALVSKHGVAVLTGIPRNQLQHLKLRWEGA